MINVTEAKTAELVAFYNEFAEKPVKKFADRKTAERRVAALVAELEAQEDQLDLVAEPTEAKIECAACGIDYLANGWDDVNQGKNTLCLACGSDAVTGESIQGRPKNKKASASIAASWKNEEVKAKRAQRHGVKVDGEEYRSVRAAFQALGLPLSKHIKFRMELKAAGSLTAYGKTWEVFEK